VSFVAKVTDQVCGVGYYSLRNELPPTRNVPPAVRRYRFMWPPRNTWQTIVLSSTVKGFI
jgi:hypothetical protein